MSDNNLNKVTDVNYFNQFLPQSKEELIFRNLHFSGTRQNKLMKSNSSSIKIQGLFFIKYWNINFNIPFHKFIIFFPDTDNFKFDPEYEKQPDNT